MFGWMLNRPLRHYLMNGFRLILLLSLSPDSLKLVLLHDCHEYSSQKTNPFNTVLGYATVLAEDGRPMHKSWGNYIEFNEGADKIGVDVLRWMYAKQQPADNILFGYKKLMKQDANFT